MTPRPSINRRLLVLLAAAASVCAPSLLFAQQARPFIAVVEESFHLWDADGDGTITREEIDSILVSTAVTKEQAAAASAIKLAMRSKKVQMGPLSREKLAEAASTAPPPTPTTPPTPDDDVEDDARLSPPNLQKRYAAALKKIQRASPELFGAAGPKLDACHQGPLGDCYFVAVVGGLLHARPEELKALYTPGSGGAVTVTFPDRKPVEIAALSEGQIAVSSTSGSGGRWLPVLEHAFGTIRLRTKPDDGQPDEPTDLIAKGGYAGETIELLTGHDASRINLAPMLKEPPTAEKLAEIRDAAREVLRRVKAGSKLAAVGTSKEQKTPGITPNHAFAVLDFDEAADTVTIWNPHGNTFKPKGPAGLEHGYLTSRGTFTMPLEDMVLTFRGLVYETDRKAEPDAKPNRKKSGEVRPTRGAGASNNRVVHARA